VEEWINADKEIVVSSTIADVNPDSGSKTLDNESSDEEIVTEKISWVEGAGAFLHF
jgi:hypothetical protein